MFVFMFPGVNKYRYWVNAQKECDIPFWKERKTRIIYIALLMIRRQVKCYARDSGSMLSDKDTRD